MFEPLVQLTQSLSTSFPCFHMLLYMFSACNKYVFNITLWETSIPSLQKSFSPIGGIGIMKEHSVSAKIPMILEGPINQSGFEEDRFCSMKVLFQC